MSSSTPKVTALVPSFNHGDYIEQRIESIINQSYPNIELIVIDDLSTDNSHTIITQLQQKYGFSYIRNEKNTGTPFAAWEAVLSFATGDYIWICESDDFAEIDFVETAIDALVANKNAVLFYCNSWVVNSNGERVDHTETYFRDTWREQRWEVDFVANGHEELAHFQLRGQTVPNMSSALISSSAFRNAYTPFLKKLKLTGDWLFIGEVLNFGDAIFSKQTLSNFRRHEQTARVRVKSALSQAEFILTKYLLFKNAKRPIREFANLMKTDAVRFLHETATYREVLNALLKISWSTTLQATLLLTLSVSMNRKYITNFFERYKLLQVK
jgi:glycosyltransferase involved in cell wall biosynthesis